jgi:thiamine-phosphate pyrophosphorylase
VQYRAKAGVDPAIVRALRAVTANAGALLIVNDDLEAALEADGLHVGPEDLNRLGDGLRARLGERVLGVSCGSIGEVGPFSRLDADYFGVGPYAATLTKADAGPPIGAAGVAAVVKAAAPLPIVAIGAICLGDLVDVARSGARMAAVASAFSAAADPEAALRALVVRWAEVTGP